MDITENMWGMFNYLKGNELKVPMDYREVGLYIIPGDSRHISELPIKNKKRQAFSVMVSLSFGGLYTNDSIFNLPPEV